MQGRRSFAGFTSTSTSRLTPSRKVVRKSASTKDLRVLSEKICLEKVLGLTTTNANGLTCNPLTGILAYPAGCVIVLLNALNGTQSHIFNPDRKTITALVFSIDGKYLASGECGYNPSVRVWEIGEPSVQTCELQGHKYGINCVAFSPNMKYLVSIGDQHDMLVNIWNWRTGDKVACNKVGWKVRALSFSASGNFFVTVGNRHVKFWYFDTEAPAALKSTKPINGRSAILGDNKNSYFCDVACGSSKDISDTYCITKGGLLCAFDEKRILYKWVDLTTTSASCLAVNSKYIFCGCSDGLIHAFSPGTLEYIATLPQPHQLGVDVAKGVELSHMTTRNPQEHSPDVVSLALDNNLNKLTCTYNDHSLYCWDIRNIDEVIKTSSYLYHSACIWGIQAYPYHTDNSYLPYGSFLTCSSDDTIRVWNLEDDLEPFPSFPRNIYSKELLKVTYTDREMSNLKDVSLLPGSATPDGKSGIRCINISPDGQLLAVGDRSGNLRVYDLPSVDLIVKVEAHLSEILCVEFSPPESGHKLLATSSRDRLIHIFDVNRDFYLLQTIDEHSSSITAVRFNYENSLFQLLSCGSDKSIMFHKAQTNEDGSIHFVRNSIVVGKATMYDMDIEPTRRYATTVGQDRKVRIYDIQTAKQTKCYKGTLSEDGTLIKIHLDPSGVYAATSCSDKTFSVYDFDSGDCVAVMHGHSEIVTGLSFTVDGKRLISVSGDGCIFIWKVPLAFRQSIAMKMRHLGMPLPKCMEAELDPFSAIKLSTKSRTPSYDDDADVISPDTEFSPALGALPEHEVSDPEELGDYRFSIGRLPGWAKKQITGSVSQSTQSRVDAQFMQATGRWAQKEPGRSLVPAAVYEDANMDSTLMRPASVDLSPSDDGERRGTETGPSTPHRKSTRSSWSRPSSEGDQRRLSKSVPNFNELNFNEVDVSISLENGSYVSSYVASRSTQKRSSFFKKARQELMQRLGHRQATTATTTATSPTTTATATTIAAPSAVESSQHPDGTHLSPSSVMSSTRSHPSVDHDNEEDRVFDDDDDGDVVASSCRRLGQDDATLSTLPPPKVLPKTPQTATDRARGDEQSSRRLNIVSCDIPFDHDVEHVERPLRVNDETIVVVPRNVDARTTPDHAPDARSSQPPPHHKSSQLTSTVGANVTVLFNGKELPTSVSDLDIAARAVSTPKRVNGNVFEEDTLSLFEDTSDQERLSSDDDAHDSSGESPLKEHFDKLADTEPIIAEHNSPPQRERNGTVMDMVGHCRSSISAKFLSRSQQSQARYKPSTWDSAPQRQLKTLCNLIDDQQVVPNGPGYQAKPISPPDHTPPSLSQAEPPRNADVDENLLRAAQEIDVLAKNLKEITFANDAVDPGPSLSLASLVPFQSADATIGATRQETMAAPTYFSTVASPTKRGSDSSASVAHDFGTPRSRDRRIFESVTVPEPCTTTAPSEREPPPPRRRETRPRATRPQSLILPSVPSLQVLMPAVSLLNRTSSDPELDTDDVATTQQGGHVAKQNFASNNLQRQSLAFTISIDSDDDSPVPLVNSSRSSTRHDDTVSAGVSAGSKSADVSAGSKSGDVLWLYQVGDSASSSADSRALLPERDTSEVDPALVSAETLDTSSASERDSCAISQSENGANTDMSVQLSDAMSLLESGMQRLTDLQATAIENNLVAIEDDVTIRLKSFYNGLTKTAASNLCRLNTHVVPNSNPQVEPDAPGKSATAEFEQRRGVDELVVDLAVLSSASTAPGERQAVLDLLDKYSNLMLAAVSMKLDVELS